MCFSDYIRTSRSAMTDILNWFRFYVDPIFLVCHLTDTTKAGLITLPLIYLSVIDLIILENFDRVAGTERLARGNGIDKILFGELSCETGSVAAAVPRLDADKRSIESGRRP